GNTKRAHVDHADVVAIDETAPAKPAAATPNQDDGLQADERSIQSDLAQAKNPVGNVHQLLSAHSPHNSFAEAGFNGNADTQRADVNSANPAVPLDKTMATPKPSANPNQDDGLQADERSIQSDLADEKARKAEKDVVLHEVANILADEVNLLRTDTKLAARVLPHSAIEKPLD
ncbi:MAG TPA: hypothetical protein VFN69_11190, partial [Rudaea sp.]|nr:hypothetical protein [Rudaea sp.]